MDAITPRVRIVIVARPAHSRLIAAALHAPGYEVHRSPGGASVPGLLERLRPQLVVVALDVPWLDGAALARELAQGVGSVPVLVVGDPGNDPREAALPWVPQGAPAERVREAVADLLRP